MKRYALLIGIMLGVMLSIFAVVEVLEIPILIEPTPSRYSSGAVAGIAGVTLLVVDVVLPIPSSLVMVTHGAIFGLWLGALLSLVGSLGAGLAAFYIGRCGGPYIDRFVRSEARVRGDEILAAWGDVAIIVSRSIPVIAETVAILAGASSMTWRRMTLATIIGAIPTAIFYAVLGALAVSANSLIWIAGSVLIIAGIYWIADRGNRNHQQSALMSEE